MHSVHTLTTALVLLSCSSAFAAEPDVATLRQAWSDRQSRFPTVQFDCTEMATSRDSSDGKPATNAHRITLSLGAASTVRYEREGASWSPQHAQLLHRHFLCTFDGETSRVVFSGAAYRESPVGFDQIARGFQERQNYHVLPMLWACRPMDSALVDLPLDQFVYLESARIDGDPCFVFQQAMPGGTAFRYWISPGLDYSIVRREWVSPTKTIERIDVSYSRDPATGVLPASWKHVMFRADSHEVDSRVVTTVNSSVVGKPLPTDEFLAKFEVGTVVTDDKLGANYRIGPNGRRVLIGWHRRPQSK